MPPEMTRRHFALVVSAVVSYAQSDAQLVEEFEVGEDMVEGEEER
jgi:hypothetical protein